MQTSTKYYKTSNRTTKFGSAKLWENLKFVGDDLPNFCWGSWCPS